MDSSQSQSQPQPTMTCWTPSDRDEWIASSVQSDKDRDTRNGYTFNTMLKQPISVAEQEDPRRTFVTASLAKTLYDNHPLLKRLSLCFYKALMMKVQQNSFLELMYRKRNFIVMVKGSNAYKMLLRHVPHANSVLEYSDLDIIVFINPSLQDELFEQIKGSLVILISQVMSRYKKDLDATLFASNNNVEEAILRSSFVQSFKGLYASMLKSYEEQDYKMLSPFESCKVRNFCSKRSFVIVSSEAKQDHVVRVEVPHLSRCEFIPLKKTPIVLSHNKTIEFQRDTEGKYLAHFELLRLRINNMLVPNKSSDSEEKEHGDDSVSECGSELCASEVSRDHSVEGGNREFYDYKKCKVIPADFIDVSIPCKDDAELLDFWNSGGFRRCYEIYDRFVGANIMIPNINECIRDLSNILNVYTNSHMKIEKRQKRLDMFKLLDENRKSAAGITPSS